MDGVIVLEGRHMNRTAVAQVALPRDHRGLGEARAVGWTERGWAFFFLVRRGEGLLGEW